MCAQVTLTKTGLSAVRTFSPLGVKSMQIWLGKKFTYFYVHNFSEVWVVLAPNPTVGENNNFTIYLQKKFGDE
jgi:hypothetical protein